MRLTKFLEVIKEQPHQTRDNACACISEILKVERLLQVQIDHFFEESDTAEDRERLRADVQATIEGLEIIKTLLQWQ